MHPKLTDYWDTRVGAIEAAGRHLERCNKSQRAATLREIEGAVTEHVRVMSDAWVVHAAVSFADDLYKAASSIQWWNDDLDAYLAASAGIFSRLLSERGFQVQYLVDNAWEDPTRLLELLPEWYTAAGIVFCCPQVISCQLAQHDGVDSKREIAELARRYEAEARHVADQIVTTSQQDCRHLIHLDANAVESSFDKAMERCGASGVLTIYRDAEPVPGSTVRVWSPKGFAYPASP